MTKLNSEINGTVVRAGTVHAWWLGGAGFVFKLHDGTIILIDPYLSNLIAQTHGLERDFPPPISPSEIKPDLVISTHWHEDHLDPVSLPIIAKNSGTIFICPPSAMSRLVGWGVPRRRVISIEENQIIEFRDVKITGTPARHVVETKGWETPDAIGVIIEINDLKIYHTGDTEYDLRLRALKSKNIDVMLTVINGTGGNMDAYESALLAWHLGVNIAIPMHHLLVKGGWPGATNDPNLFKNTYEKLGGKGEIRILNLGEETVLTKESTFHN